MHSMNEYSAMKMNTIAALFFAVAALMVTADGYDSFSPEDKELINRLIRVANEKFKASGKDFEFSQTLNSEYDNTVLRILLKPTGCSHDCVPQIDCIACRETFIDCQKKREVWKTEADRENNCNRYRPGKHVVGLELIED